MSGVAVVAPMGVTLVKLRNRSVKFEEQFPRNNAEYLIGSFVRTADIEAYYHK